MDMVLERSNLIFVLFLSSSVQGIDFMSSLDGVVKSIDQSWESVRSSDFAKAVDSKLQAVKPSHWSLDGIWGKFSQIPSLINSLFPIPCDFNQHILNSKLQQ
jgi:hypothetical protein